MITISFLESHTFQSAVQRQTKPIIATSSMQIHKYRERVVHKGEESYRVNNEEISYTWSTLQKCRNAHSSLQVWLVIFLFIMQFPLEMSDCLYFFGESD